MGLVNKSIDCDFKINKIKEKEIDGVYFYKSGKVFMGGKVSRIKNLDEIPSPYLTGLLDKFFEKNLIPIIETNRGCPYQCTFCCQGFSSFHQMHFFSMERVKSELEYISKHVKNTHILNLADSNFGIVERDMEIAKFISELNKRTGYPHVVSCNLAKNQPKIYELSKILNTLIVVSTDRKFKPTSTSKL